MAFVDWSSVAQCRCGGGATNTPRVPLVRPGSNIMLRLLTLTCSQPGYRLLMLTETVGGQEAVRPGQRACLCPSRVPTPHPFTGHCHPHPLLLGAGPVDPPRVPGTVLQGCCCSSHVPSLPCSVPQRPTRGLHLPGLPATWASGWGQPPGARDRLGERRLRYHLSLPPCCSSPTSGVSVIQIPERLHPCTPAFSGIGFLPPIFLPGEGMASLHSRPWMLHCLWDVPKNFAHFVLP